MLADISNYILHPRCNEMNELPLILPLASFVALIMDFNISGDSVQ